ncbi:YhcH/YjgK/YiaL family protein [Facklamia sp. 7083-14-GEN3]|uniref:YhcH/YjgK/YiaL family protein n=1 Tax=Facklamia sp. 7083-14-GEN3 TaxID=2973478 RepID=UPI00215C7CB4|nr:YhcH/YjgK/YiaL family protein [Facklamia sp. 7083-14-GEN3]MCR8968807.1 YhcH/YjgK/YiaL family protein [Facklamia sp. 7083-14-GEN3]
MELYDLNHINHIQREGIIRVIKFLKENGDLINSQPGPHIISDDFYYNILEYDTTTDDQRVWESHRSYLDVHVPIKGKERIWHNFIGNVQLGEYVEKDDWQQSQAQPLSELIVQPGQILVFDREDIHKTGLIVDHAEKIKKAVFKVKY